MFDGTDLTDKPGEPPVLRRRMQMIFQDPYASLDPRWRVRDITAEPLLSFGLARSRAEAAHEFDLFISHDLAVVWFLSDVIGAMYLGRLVETGPARRVFAAPQHPYSRLLLETIPDVTMARRDRQPVAGEVPNPISPPPGCPPAALSFASERCRREVPVLRRRAPSGADAACHGVEERRLPAPAPLPVPAAAAVFTTLAAQDRCRLLCSFVAPRPIALVTTVRAAASRTQRR